MNENSRNWKKVTSGLMALTMVAGTVPANVGFLTAGSTIVANADAAPLSLNPEIEEEGWEVSWIWDAQYEVAFARVKGPDMEKAEGVVADIQIEEEPATCGADGLRIYKAVAEFEDHIFKDQKEVVIPALEHAWQAPEYEWADAEEGGKTCTATRICANGDHPETETVEATYTVITAPTISTKGKGLYTVSFENDVFEDQTLEVELDELEPEYAEPEYVWAEDYSTVTATKRCTNGDDSYSIVEVAEASAEITTDPTCTEKGVTTYTAEFENEDFVKQIKEVENIPATGHTYGEPEWIWAEDYSSATARFTCEEEDDVTDKDVTPTYKVLVPASCGEVGSAAYVATVTLDGKTYSDTKVAEIPAEGHNWSIKWYWEPTEDGTSFDSVVAYCKCTHGDAEEAIIADIEGVVTVAACSGAGKMTYTAKIELDGKEITDIRTVDIPASDHTFDEPKYTWEETEDGMKCTASHKCTECGEVETEEAVVKYDVVAKPTIKNSGIGLYTAEFKNPDFDTQTEVKVLDKLVPNYDTPDYKWSEDYSTMTATRKCTNGSEEDDIVVVVETTSEVTQEATCSEMGVTTYKATFDSDFFTTQTVNVTNIEMVPHKFGVPVWNWILQDDGTYTAVPRQICSECGAVEDVDCEVEVNAVTANGIITYTATAVIDDKTYSSIIQVAENAKNTPEISFEKGDECVKLTWTEVKGAEKYGIVGYVNGAWKLLDQGYNTSYVLKNLKSGTNYKVAVMCMFNGEWTMDFSNSIIVTPNTSKVPAVSFEKGEGAVKLTWTEVEGAEKYGIVGYQNGKWVTLDQGYVTSYVLKNLKAGTNYKVAVVAMIDGKWNMDTSNAIVVTPLNITLPVISYEKGDSAVKLTWTEIEGAEKYGVAGFVNGKWQLLDQGKGTSYVLKDLKAGNEYKVSVVAMIGGKWNMDTSNAIVVSPNEIVKPSYPTVTNIVYNKEYHQFKMKWDAVEGATQYGVAVKVAGKWKVYSYTEDTVFTSPKLKEGSKVEMVVCAKVGGKWDTSNLNSRAFTVTVK